MERRQFTREFKLVCVFQGSLEFPSDARQQPICHSYPRHHKIHRRSYCEGNPRFSQDAAAVRCSWPIIALASQIEPFPPLPGPIDGNGCPMKYFDPLLQCCKLSHQSGTPVRD
jgi:hypothetical protein